MKHTAVIVLTIIIIVAGWLVYTLTQNSSTDTGGAGVAVSPYDFDASGCVGDAEDLAELQRLCPAEGGSCNVLGEADAIQAALKFAEASNTYPCE
ncbi:MAG: hypothetical protein Q8P01_00400 [bacterium]|nr:hypothetical protein [bacterium]